MGEGPFFFFFCIADIAAGTDDHMRETVMGALTAAHMQCNASTPSLPLYFLSFMGFIFSYKLQ